MTNTSPWLSQMALIEIDDFPRERNLHFWSLLWIHQDRWDDARSDAFLFGTARTARLALEAGQGRGEDVKIFRRWMVYPLVNLQKAIENGPFIVDLPIKNGDFQ